MGISGARVDQAERTVSVKTLRQKQLDVFMNMERPGQLKWGGPGKERWEARAVPGGRSCGNVEMDITVWGEGVRVLSRKNM